MTSSGLAWTQNWVESILKALNIIVSFCSDAKKKKKRLTKLSIVLTYICRPFSIWSCGHIGGLLVVVKVRYQ